MDWDNERYIRLYTRDSVNVAMMHWQSRNALWELLRKVDRAGVIDIGAHDPTRALANLMRMPDDIVDQCLTDWLKVGTVELHEKEGNTYLVVPNFLPASEAKQSDAVRSKKSRDKRRDVARLRTIVTNCDGTQAPTPEPAEGPESTGSDTPRAPDDTPSDVSDTLATPCDASATQRDFRDTTTLHYAKATLSERVLRARARAGAREGSGANGDKSHSPEGRVLYELMTEFPSLSRVCTLALAEQAICNTALAGGDLDLAAQHLSDLARDAGTAEAAGSPWSEETLTRWFGRYTGRGPSTPGGRRPSRRPVAPQQGDSEERRNISRKAWEESKEYQDLAERSRKAGF